MTTTLVFALFAVLLFGVLLTFAAVVDHRRGRRLSQDTSRIHQPEAARRRWRRQRP